MYVYVYGYRKQDKSCVCGLALGLFESATDGFFFRCDCFLRGHTVVAGCLNSQTLRRHTPCVRSTATANLTSTAQVCGLGPH